MNKFIEGGNFYFEFNPLDFNNDVELLIKKAKELHLLKFGKELHFRFKIAPLNDNAELHYFKSLNYGE